MTKRKFGPTKKFIITKEDLNQKMNNKLEEIRSFGEENPDFETQTSQAIQLYLGLNKYLSNNNIPNLPDHLNFRLVSQNDLNMIESLSTDQSNYTYFGSFSFSAFIGIMVNLVTGSAMTNIVYFGAAATFLFTVFCFLRSNTMRNRKKQIMSRIKYLD